MYYIYFCLKTIIKFLYIFIVHVSAVFYSVGFHYRCEVSLILASSVSGVIFATIGMKKDSGQ